MAPLRTSFAKVSWLLVRYIFTTTQQRTSIRYDISMTLQNKMWYNIKVKHSYWGQMLLFFLLNAKNTKRNNDKKKNLLSIIHLLSGFFALKKNIYTRKRRQYNWPQQRCFPDTQIVTLHVHCCMFVQAKLQRKTCAMLWSFVVHEQQSWFSRVAQCP